MGKYDIILFPQLQSLYYSAAYLNEVNLLTYLLHLLLISTFNWIQLYDVYLDLHFIGLVFWLQSE